MRESTEINLNGPRKGSAGKNRKFFPIGWNANNANGSSPPIANKSSNQTPRGGWMTSDEERIHNLHNNYQRFEDNIQV